MFHSGFPANKELVTIEQAREIAQVSRRTIYLWIKSGKIDYYRTASGSIRIVEESLFSKTDKSAWDLT